MRNPTGIRVAATSARVIAGVAVSATVVAGAIFAVPTAWPSVQHEPAQQAVVPIAGDVQLTCAGAFRAQGRDVLNAAKLSLAGVTDVTVAASQGTQIENEPLAITELEDEIEGTIYVGRSGERAQVLLSAAESITLADDDLAGFAAAACRLPSMESWIVGGAASTGTSDVILLANPSDVTATAALTIYGGTGEVRGRDIVLPPRTQTAFPLAAGAAGERTPVVRVTASGAPVRAMLQSSLIRTLDPSGIDLQDGTGQPKMVQTLAGVTVIAEATDAAATTILRVLAPSQDSRVTVTARAADGAAVAGKPTTVLLKAGQPAEINVTGLTPGVYSFEVDAEAPVVAAVWQTSGLSIGADYSWMTPAPELVETTPFSVPAGPPAQLHVRNVGDKEATVVLRDAGTDAARTIVLPADGSILEPVANGASYLLETNAPVHAAVTMSASRAIAGWPLWPIAGVADAITIYP